jgi:anti-sigma-K factor RskA
MDVSDHRERHVDLCAGYALGSLDPGERRLLEEHLATGCPVCDAALLEFSAASTLLAASETPAGPGTSLKGRVMEAVHGDRPAARETAARETAARETAVAAVRSDAIVPERAPAPDRATSRTAEMEPRRGKPHLATAWAVAASFFMVAGILWVTSARLRGQLAASREETSVLRQTLAEEERWASVMSAPGARIALLTVTEAGPELRARAVYDPSTRHAVLVFDNFTPPEGGDYEVWAIRNGVPSSLGIVKANEAGRAMMRIEEAGDSEALSAFAVSLEPPGGAPGHAAPTGPVVMSGTLSE